MQDSSFSSVTSVWMTRQTETEQERGTSLHRRVKFSTSLTRPAQNIFSVVGNFALTRLSTPTEGEGSRLNSICPRSPLNMDFCTSPSTTPSELTLTGKSIILPYYTPTEKCFPAGKRHMFSSQGFFMFVPDLHMHFLFLLFKFVSLFSSKLPSFCLSFFYLFPKSHTASCYCCCDFAVSELRSIL